MGGPGKVNLSPCVKYVSCHYLEFMNIHTGFLKDLKKRARYQETAIPGWYRFVSERYRGCGISGTGVRDV